MTFSNAQEAFESYYDLISELGDDFDNTKTLFNQGFTILNPLDNKIDTDFRKWSNKYANRETIIVTLDKLQYLYMTVKK